MESRFEIITSGFDTTLNFRRVVLVDEEDPQLFPFKLGGNDDFVLSQYNIFLNLT